MRVKGNLGGILYNRARRMGTCAGAAGPFAYGMASVQRTGVIFSAANTRIFQP
jgi:hypothetical protein